jgi:Fuc2NAc and GlcNAc transferase
MNTPILAIVALTISWILVAIIRKWSQKYQILDIPNDRSSHTKPTSRGGGLAIVVTTLVGCALYKWRVVPESNVSVMPYFCGGLLIASVSLLDDLYSLSNRLRFGAHTVAGIVAIAAYGGWQLVQGSSTNSAASWVGGLITLLWIVGLTNAYNFMDGIDGIAGGQAVVAGVGWYFIGSFVQSPAVQILGLLIAASSLGFLGHNWPPARIFMGDVGSAFLGFSFAVMPLMTSRTQDLAMPSILLLWPFLFDSIFTFLRRLIRGENVFKAHRSHLYQRLTQSGRSHRRVTCIYIALATVGALLAAGWVHGTSLHHIAILTVLPCMCLGLWLYTVRSELQAKQASISSLPGAQNEQRLLPVETASVRTDARNDNQGPSASNGNAETDPSQVTA